MFQFKYIQYKNKFPTFTEFLWQSYTGFFSLSCTFLELLLKIMGIWCHASLPNDLPPSHWLMSVALNQSEMQKEDVCEEHSLITTDTFYLLLLIVLPFSVNSPSVGHYPSLVGSPCLWNCCFHSIRLHHFDCLSQLCTYLHPPLFSQLSLDLYKEHMQWEFKKWFILASLNAKVKKSSSYIYK